MGTPEKRYSADDMISFATELLQHAGIALDRAHVIAEILAEGDLMGHTTHGLQLLAAYLTNLEAGTMAKDGDPIVIADKGSAITWDGQYLPGPWLTHQAMELAFERIRQHPVVTVVIRHSHHIGCLAAYPKKATDKGLLMILTCSDPSVKTVARGFTAVCIHYKRKTPRAHPSAEELVIILWVVLILYFGSGRSGYVSWPVAGALRLQPSIRTLLNTQQEEIPFIEKRSCA